MGTDLLPFSEVAALVAAASTLGVFLLAPLYLSQRRDVRRLCDWMSEAPDYPITDLARSEAALDSAEVELERLYADRGQPVPATSERPALDQITMERAALLPHPRWRRFKDRATQPRWLAVIALVALALGSTAIVGVQQLLRDGGEGGAASEDDGAGIEVAVLNTTTASGIAGRVARDIEELGFLRGSIGNIARDTQQTVVMYQPDRKRAARRLAKEFDGAVVQAIDREVQAVTEGADVVVVLGEDRVGG